MRGLDTNVLVRYLTADDPHQSPRAKSLLERAEKKGESFFISTVVLCELAWTLRSKSYGFDRPTIAETIEQLLATPLFVIQDRDLAVQAVRRYRSGRADFPDYLLGFQNRKAGCIDTVTFDARLGREKGFALPD